MNIGSWNGIIFLSQKRREKIVDSQKYDADKLRKIIETTLSNYANMIKRLERKKNVAEIMLIYYSVFLIVGTLTGKYFPQHYNVIWNEYFNIILSIVVLIFSLVNKNANYASRIDSLMDSLNGLKTIKRKLDDDSIEKYNEKYNEIVDKTERRNDTDFFRTVKQLCREYKISWIKKKRKGEDFLERNGYSSEMKEKQDKVINNYLSEINVMIEEIKIIFEYFLDTVLFAIPIIIFIFCVVIE